MKKTIDNELKVLNEILHTLKPFDKEAQTYILAAAILTHRLVGIDMAQAVVREFRESRPATVKT